MHVKCLDRTIYGPTGWGWKSHKTPDPARHLARLDGLKFHAYEFEFEVDFTPEVVNDRFGGFEVFGMGPFGFQVITDGDRGFSAGHVRVAIADFIREN